MPGQIAAHVLDDTDIAVLGHDGGDMLDPADERGDRPPTARTYAELLRAASASV